MDVLSDKKELLDSLQLTEGESFKFNQKEILNEYALKEENKSSLYIKVLSIFGGIIGMLAFIGFLFLAQIYETPAAMLSFGVLCVAGAIGINILYEKITLDTFSVALYITGLALLGTGLTYFGYNLHSLVLIGIIISLATMYLTQNYVLSFISVIAISGGFMSLFIIYHTYELIHLYISIITLILSYWFLHEAKIISLGKKMSKLYDPIRIALIFSLLGGLFVIGTPDIIFMNPQQVWISSIVILAVMIYLVYSIVTLLEIKDTVNKILIYSLSGIILLTTLFSPAISGSLIILLLSYKVNYKTGLAIGILAFLYFISRFYYDLHFTLLTKSIILMASGLIFLLFYVLTTKKLNTNEKV